MEYKNKQATSEDFSNANNLEGTSNATEQISPPPFQLKAESSEEEKASKEDIVDTKQFSNGSEDDGSDHRSSSVGNQKNNSLPFQLKKNMESMSGFSLNDVNVHYNSYEPAQLKAHAFARGSNIHIAPGQEQQLPHEAWHVVQQKQGRVHPTSQLKSEAAINDDPTLEKEADEMGAKAAQLKANSSSKSALLSKPNNSNFIQRKLTYWTSTGEEKEFTSFQDLATKVNELSSKNITKQFIIDHINSKLTDNTFSETLFNHYISIIDDYPEVTGAGALVKFALDFYNKIIKTMEADATSTESTTNYTELVATYDETEADDGMEVKDKFSQKLACSLFALIAVKGSFLGASKPEDLHTILRSLKKFKVYDDDKIIGLLRIQAGLTYSTAHAGKTVTEFISGLKKADEGRKIVIDMDKEAHTFALIYQSGAWKRFDNGSADGYKTGMAVGSQGAKKISVTWE